nr:glycosyltransferase [Desulfamplus magnetovallimortis]
MGGLEKRVFNESRWMEEKGHTIVIAAPPNTPLSRKAISRKWQYFPVQFTSRTMLKDFLTLKKLYVKIKPDILNTHGNSDSKVALAAAYQSPIPCSILSRHISADVSPTWYNKLLYQKLCTHIFTTADYTTLHLKIALELDGNKVITIPSGINPPVPLPDRDSSINALTKELKVAPDAKFIGYVGRVSIDKGVMDIINGFISVAEKIPGYHLVIVGDGEKGFLDDLDSSSRALIRKHSSIIHFTGFRENTWPYYSAFDCKLLASREVEGISQSILEAMFSLCPVAASRVGGNMDIISHGESGILFSGR